MSSERDIDDILESLNQLLREGESHNDDHVEPDEVSESDLQAGEEAPQEPGQESALAEAEEIPVADEEPAAAAEDAVENEIVSEPVDAGAEVVSEPEGQDDADDDSSDDGDAPLGGDGSALSMQRVVLTEEMLVDNPQGSLLSLVRAAEAKAALRLESGGADEAQGRQGGLASTQGLLHVDHEHMGQLLEQLSDDVINRLRQELPSLIRDSLYRHLEELKIENQQTGAAEEQRSAQQQLKEQKRDE